MTFYKQIHADVSAKDAEDNENRLNDLKKELAEIKSGKEVWKDREYLLQHLSNEIKTMEENLQDNEDYSSVEISERFTV